MAEPVEGAGASAGAEQPLASTDTTISAAPRVILPWGVFGAPFVTVRCGAIVTAAAGPLPTVWRLRAEHGY